MSARTTPTSAGSGVEVLFVIDSLAMGGAERSLVEMLPGLAGHGVRPIVSCLYRRPRGLEAEVLGSGCDVRFLPGRTLAAKAAGLRRLIRERRPDVVHTSLLLATMVGRAAAVRLPTIVLTSLVNTTYSPIRYKDPNVRALPLRAFRILDGWTARTFTHHFHAVTRAVRDSAVEQLGISPARVSVIERGRDPGRLGLPGDERRREVRRRLGLADDAEVLINVGRQEFQKGQRYLLEAVAALAPSRPGLVLLIAGRDGHATPQLRALAAGRGLRGRVRFLGDRRDVPDLLAASDLFVFPSLYEGLGGAQIEAMALGLPVIASDLPSLREVVEDGGNAVLVPPESPEALVAAILRLLEDPETARAFGRRGREIFEQRFTLARSVRRMADLYADLVGNGRRR